MTRESKLDLYDLLRKSSGNEPVEPEKLPEPDRGTGRSGGAKTTTPRRARSGRTGPVTVRRADPRLWEAAREAADGDTSRLEILADGSVVIHNQPIR
ncbi:hypothetical protein GCM10010182_45980 [Actinomadura cremea]|nr:hypothetical protein GCM10010182_45980 [Actinomadura cremea]